MKFYFQDRTLSLLGNKDLTLHERVNKHGDPIFLLHFLMFISLITPSFKKSSIVEQFQGTGNIRFESNICVRAANLFPQHMFPSRNYVSAKNKQCFDSNVS